MKRSVTMGKDGSKGKLFIFFFFKFSSKQTLTKETKDCILYGNYYSAVDLLFSHYVHLSFSVYHQLPVAVWLGLINKISWVGLGKDGLGCSRSCHNVNNKLQIMTSPMCVFFWSVSPSPQALS